MWFLQLVIAGLAFAKDAEFRLEGAFLKTENSVGAFDNSAGSGSPSRGAKVSQEMDSMESLKFSLVKPLNDYASIIGSIYTPMNGVMSPKHLLSVNTTGDGYGVAGKFKMLLAQLGGEYTIHLSDKFHSFLDASLAYFYFYDGGTDSILNPDGHAIKDFDIKNTLNP